MHWKISVVQCAITMRTRKYLSAEVQRRVKVLLRALSGQLPLGWLPTLWGRLLLTKDMAVEVHESGPYSMTASWWFHHHHHCWFSLLLSRASHQLPKC